MSVEIKVPALGESVTEATIAKWYKKPGDSVKMDELLLELETEKVTLEVNATVNGVLEAITQAENSTVEVGQVVGSIKQGAVVAKETKASVVAPAVEASKVPPAAVTDSKPSQATPAKGDPNHLSPAVRKLVTEQNLDPAAIDGSGKGGRLTKGDIINNTEKVAAPAATANNPDEKPVERVRMSRLRKTIAQRLKDSQNTAAILTTFNEIDMHNVMSLRKKYKDNFQEKHEVKLGFMSFFVKAVVNALKEVPSVNAEIDGDEIIYKHYYDIGVAVGTEQGLVVPVVRHADQLGFAAIEQEIASLAQRARNGKLSMAELSGGTFSITNGGVYGSLLSTPIINPPQTGIIGLHNTQQRPVVVDGKIEIRPMMYIALSYDHRIIDGKDAVTFLVKVKEAIENPERLLLDL